MYRTVSPLGLDSEDRVRDFEGDSVVTETHAGVQRNSEASLRGEGITGSSAIVAALTHVFAPACGPGAGSGSLTSGKDRFFHDQFDLAYLRLDVCSLHGIPR